MTPAHETQPLARWRVIDTIFLASVRADMRTELARLNYDDATIDAVALVMTELAGNAFQHGAAPVEVGLDVGPHALMVRVTDAGDGFDEELAALLVDDQQTALNLNAASSASDALAELAEGGRGLQIASTLADIHVIQRVIDGAPRTTVIATLTVDAPTPPAADTDPLGTPDSHPQNAS